MIEKPLCEVGDGSEASVAMLGVACHEAPTGKQGILGAKRATLIVPLEAWVCAGCSYTELYTRFTEVLEHLATHRSDVVRVVDADEPATGPFR